MKLSQNQTKLVQLTMQLDLKTREYQKLCAEFDVLKQKNIDPNDEEFAILLAQLQQNSNEIKNINTQLIKLKLSKTD